MKKSLLILTLSLACTVHCFLSAQVGTRISIANGNWSNPAIWSPAGVPTPSDDSIIVNTAVTFNQNIADGLTWFQVTLNGSLIDQGMDTIALGGNDAKIQGYMSCDVFAVGMNNQFHNYGTINVATDLAQSGIFYNETPGKICVGQNLGTSDNFTNFGSIATNNWLNSAAANGTGMYCIANYFINSSSITGTLDICDATPNTPWDQNMGTIAGTVTYCTMGPCSNCPLTGIDHTPANADALKIFPDPFVNEVHILVDPAFVDHGADAVFSVYDVNGKCIYSENISSGEIVFERNNLPSGMYFYRFVVNGQLYNTGRLVAE
ncbi:MAG TPA: T9SS type A sorting domain-containing protein [Bacteroidia bacterium]|nr:T9SS type A sorting domain-containing protein [Bacteroidia bacterium]